MYFAIGDLLPYFSPHFFERRLFPCLFAKRTGNASYWHEHRGLAIHPELHRVAAKRLSHIPGKGKLIF
jgi:hypothetical protein